MLEAISKYQFLQNAIIAGILASIVCGIIGVIIVEKRLIMMSGGIAHTAYGGVGLGYLCGFTPIIGAMIFSVLAALGIGYVKKKNKSNSDIVIALFWSLGMALGVAFIGFMPGYPPDMNSYLFGNILSVTKADINAMLIMASVVILAILVFYNDWKAYLFDEEFSEIIGMKTNIMQYALLILIALTVVTLIR
ncbi:MAG: metal ABC transporter permease, partial [Oscillospiraceae bacterium]